ncbi:MAG: hypothetical protein J6R20_01800 [Clostridia bacterium]|nr:hypothetical protein [Clostridia bacterium]
MKCKLCSGDNASLLHLDTNGNQIYVCDGCAQDVKELLTLAVGHDINEYNKFKNEFIEDFNGNPNIGCVIQAAEAKRLGTINPPSPKTSFVQNEIKTNNKSTSETINSFIPYKLLLSSILAVISLFLPIIGIIFAIFANVMSSEIPYDFSPTDVKRANMISNCAIYIHLVEIVILIIACINLFS